MRATFIGIFKQAQNNTNMSFEILLGLGDTSFS